EQIRRGADQGRGGAAFVLASRLGDGGGGLALAVAEVDEGGERVGRGAGGRRDGCADGTRRGRLDHIRGRGGIDGQRTAQSHHRRRLVLQLHHHPLCELRADARRGLDRRPVAQRDR